MGVANKHNRFLATPIIALLRIKLSIQFLYY